MKHWGSALFPVSILAALTILTFWLRYATEMTEPRRDGKTRHDPDYIVSDIVLRKLDQQGQLKYTLKAIDVRHYPDDDTTDLQKPNVVYQYVKKPPLTISAERGHSSADGERVDLLGNVRLYRPASEKDEELTATMDELAVFPDDETAFTKSPVLITRGNSWLKGVGMQVNNKMQTYILESRAVGLLESKHARKK